MAGTANMTTLRCVLTQSKPEVPCKTTANRISTGPWPKFEPGTITPWNDFNLDTLNESYGHILDLKGVEINKPNDISHLVGWNDRLLRPTLAFAKHHLDLHTGVRLQHFISAPDSSCPARISDDGPALKVDHRVAVDDYPLPNLVIGLGRPSSKFHGRRLLHHSPASRGTAGNALPLRQLANLCDTAGTRYGYIMTDEDLVACCFYKAEATATAGQAAAGSTTIASAAAAAAELWTVALMLMPVPWTRHGAGQLTTDLALWWLCMLALSAPEHRALVTAADAVGIGEWEVRHLDDERGWVRRHRYSRVEKPAAPPPPPAYEAPSPGNPAAFAAPVGIHMDPTFGIDMDPTFGINMDPTFGINMDPTFGLGGDFDFGSFNAFLNPGGAMGPFEMPPTTTD